MFCGKVMVIHTTDGLIKKVLIYKRSYFPEPYTHSKKKIKVELDLSSYARKSDLKNATGIDTLKVVKEVDLASLKSDADKLDINKVKIVLADLYKLSNIVENNAVNKSVYNELVKKVKAVQTNDTSN